MPLEKSKDFEKEVKLLAKICCRHSNQRPTLTISMNLCCLVCHTQVAFPPDLVNLIGDFNYWYYEGRCILWYVSKHTTLNYCEILCKNLDISLIQQVEKIGYQKGIFPIKCNIDYSFLSTGILVHIIETQISFWKQNIESGLMFGVFSLVLIMLNLCEMWQDNKLNAEFLF